MSIPIKSLPLGNIFDDVAMSNVKPGDIKVTTSTVWEITDIDEDGNYYGYKVESILTTTNEA